MRRAVVLVLVAGSFGPVAPAAADEGPWGWPLEGSPRMTRPFAPPETRYGAGHRGVDLVASPGVPVLAAGSGRVSVAGLLAGRGVVVVVHGSLRTTYEPVSPSVGVGESVAVGEVLGTLEPGHLRCPAPACLHWGLRRGEAYLDPMRLVERGQVRLLPVPRAGAAAPSGPVRTAGVRRSPAAADAKDAGVDHDQAEGQGAAEVAWSLRAAEAPLGMAAIAALVLGIALLARPRPDPHSPVSGGTAAPAARCVVPDDVEGPDALLLDLESARLRREAS